MILTGAAFVHKQYLGMFNDSVPKSVHELVDRTQNCDDIAMNVMVAHHLARVDRPQSSGMYVKPKSIWNIEKETSELACVSSSLQYEARSRPTRILYTIPLMRCGLDMKLE